MEHVLRKYMTKKEMAIMEEDLDFRVNTDIVDQERDPFTDEGFYLIKAVMYAHQENARRRYDEEFKKKQKEYWENHPLVK